MVLLIYCLVCTMIPNLILIHTENYSIWSCIAGLFLPLGFYMCYGVISRRTGTPVVCLIWAMFFAAFQIVLSYLFGNSIIATDMFVNLFTTNPNEASELLMNIAPAVGLVIVIYLPIIAYAVYATHKHYRITKKCRRRFLQIGIPMAIVGALMLIPAKKTNEGKSVFLTEIFPANVIYNFKLCISIQHAVRSYHETSKDFTYAAQKTRHAKQREIYVYMIGEAARASNWSIMGYERNTNPELSQRDDIMLFSNVLTQSNTTHKSVPLLLSSVSAENHSEIYHRKGIVSLFHEAGFKTYFISDQSPQGGMIDFLGNEADETTFISAPRYDMQLLTLMRRIIDDDSNSDMFFVLHCYGSHFAYNQRYPKEMSHFKPDSDCKISTTNAELLRNTYDNSIRYTDHVINSIIEYLSAKDCCSALFFCSDHGEDLFDDSRGRFLHASPTVTYYQLHVPALAWFSKEYCEEFPMKVLSAKENQKAPATTHSAFHTLADMASIECEYCDSSVSLVSAEFSSLNRRYYLNDHNEAVEFDSRIGINKHDMELFKKAGIQL